MKNEYDIYNSSGEKIGEIRESNDVGSGIGLVFGILLLIIPLGAVFVWSALFQNINGNNILYIILYFILLGGADLILYEVYRENRYGFIELSTRISLISTIMVGIVYWLISKIVTGATVGELFITLFVTFLFSIIPAIIVTAIIKAKNG